MASASSGGHLDILKLFIVKDRLEILKYLVSLSVPRTEDLDEALSNSSSSG